MRKASDKPETIPRRRRIIESMSDNEVIANMTRYPQEPKGESQRDNEFSLRKRVERMMGDVEIFDFTGAKKSIK